MTSNFGQDSIHSQFLISTSKIFSCEHYRIKEFTPNSRGSVHEDNFEKPGNELAEKYLGNYIINIDNEIMNTDSPSSPVGSDKDQSNETLFNISPM